MPEEMFCWHCVYWADTRCRVGHLPTSCGPFFTPRRPAPLEAEYSYEPGVTPVPPETPPETPPDASPEVPPDAPTEAETMPVDRGAGPSDRDQG
jgi:hypothetical protein